MKNQNIKYVNEESFDDEEKKDCIVEYFKINGLIHGSKKYYNRESIELYKEENYNNGVREGFQKSWWKNNKHYQYLKSLHYIKNNITVGTHKKWILKDGLDSSRFPERWRITELYPSSIKKYRDDGKLYYECEFYDYSHQKRTEVEYSGDYSFKIFRMWYKNGKIQKYSKGVLINGQYKTDGEHKIWYEDGSLKVIQTFEKGVITSVEGFNKNKDLRG